ncbi:MAG: hypothetical protein K8F25_18350 [Fimbriimonadaceae bacterium]|nr:hypothetical protein [Alphaproteobacteria bacterium]
MTYDEFQKLLLRHGSDPDKWPELEQPRAEKLLSRDSAARELLERFEDLDVTLLDALKVEPQGAALTGRILTRVAARNRGEDRRRAVFGPGILSAFGGVAALSVVLLGFLVGSLDFVWLDGAAGSDLSFLLLGETTEFMETL